MLNFLFMMLLEAAAYIIGVYSVMDELRKNDGDLYAEWMDRREARKEERK